MNIFYRLKPISQRTPPPPGKYWELNCNRLNKNLKVIHNLIVCDFWRNKLIRNLASSYYGRTVFL